MNENEFYRNEFKVAYFEWFGNFFGLLSFFSGSVYSFIFLCKAFFLFTFSFSSGYFFVWDFDGLFFSINFQFFLHQKNLL